MDLIQKLAIAEKAIEAGHDARLFDIVHDIINTHYDELNAEEIAILLDMTGVGHEIWDPFPGPQVQALECKADELFYGGAAGGGKSDLLIGLSLTRHQHTIIYRREATQLVGILQRMSQIIGDRKGYNGQDKVWRYEDKLIEFGAVKDSGSEEKYQGRPHDLKGFDEITHFIEFQYNFLNGWKRSADPKQRVRTVATGNPPTRPEGLWVKKYWGPWLDRNNPLYGKVEPGELAYYFRNDAGEMTFLRECEPQKDEDGEEIIPRSLTFIPSRVEDNPVYMATGYKQQLQSLPEPLRSQMLKGDFEAFSDDDPMQVIPTNWIIAAQRRWEDKKTKEEKGQMLAMGVDPARGGMDNTVIAKKYEKLWFPELKLYPGGATPDGPTTVSLIVAERQDDCPVVTDIIGIGSSVVDIGSMQGLHMVGWNNAEGSPGIIDGLRFKNKRSWVYWNFRVMLDPANETGIALPLDDDLLAELAAHKFVMTPGGIQVLPKEKVKELIGRSPDRADAVVMASVDVQSRGNYQPKGKPSKWVKDGIDMTIPDDYNPYE